MPYLLLPSRWIRQPTSPVEIDWNNPLANGLLYATIFAPWNFLHTPINLAGKPYATTTTNGPLTRGYGGYGAHAKFTNTKYITIAGVGKPPGSSAIMAVTNAVPSNNTGLVNWENTPNTGTPHIYCRINSGWYAVSYFGSAPTSTSPSVYAASYTEGAWWTFFNGTPTKGNTAYGTDGGNNIYINSGYQGVNGDPSVAAVYAWKVGKSISEMRELSRRPYAFFKPVVRRIFVGGTGGVTPKTTTHYINSAIQKSDLELFYINSALQKTDSKTIDVNSAISKQDSKTVDINSALQKTKIDYHYIDSALQDTITKTVDVNAALQDTFTKTLEINSALQQAKSAYFEFNAWKEAAGVFLKTHEINAALQAGKTGFHYINAALEKNLSTYHYVNSALQKVDTKTFQINAALQDTITGTFYVNAALQDTISAIHYIDSALSAGKSHYFEINSVLAEGTKTTYHYINSALQKEFTSYVTINSVLTEVASYTTAKVTWG